MKIIDLVTVDSTNTYLKNNYQHLEDMTFVCAKYQTAGRGRGNRQWLAEEGKNLTFSVLIRDEDLIGRYKMLSVLSALSILKVLQKYGISDVSIKWPNDVYVRDEKIAGILLESVSRESLECLIIGIGLNVNQKSFQGEFLHQPVSMFQLLGQETDLDNLKKDVYQQLADCFSLLKQGHDFYRQIAENDYLKGRKAFGEVRGKEMEVEVIGIDEDCSLKIICENRIMNIESGEITFHLSSGRNI